MERLLPMADARRGPGLPPVFHRIGIVGLGLIGGSIALAARQIWPAALVIGVDNKDVLERAMVLHAIDVAADDLVVLAEADLVILAAPVLENVRLIGEVAAHIHGDAVVTDVSSTKRAIVEAARALPQRLTFVGGHPLGGAARQGIDFARPDLFAGRPWLFAPGRDVPADAADRLFTFVRALGAIPSMLDAAEHDRLLAYISHLPQLAASALMRIIGEAAGEEGLALSGRGLVDTTRLASSPASVWTDVCRTNADAIGEALDRLIAELQEVRSTLASADALTMLFAASNDWKQRLTDVHEGSARRRESVPPPHPPQE